jgi:hypothetical protein
MSALSIACCGAEPSLIVKPEAFPTLINPNCSHCRDEARRRAGELKDNDRVLCWIRGYSDGGAIPYRFFLNPYRVISDTYGVFVHDADAGFARGFTPSLDFRFHGWRNGVMVMKHKDGTLYSCLTGVAFEGPKKGERLTPIPTLVSDWGYWLKQYPQNVAYHMFDKYQPVELPDKVNEDSRKSRGGEDKRLPADTMVLGVHNGDRARAYPLAALEKAGIIQEEQGKDTWVVLWYGPTRTAAAYLSMASPPKEGPKPRRLTLTRDGKDPAPFVDQETHTRWDVAGRGIEGELKGWTLAWLDGTQVKWFAWAAEYPATTVYSASATAAPAPTAAMIAGKAEFLRGLPKHFATLRGIDATRNRVTLLVEGESLPKVWPLTAEAEVKVAGWWGRLDQFTVGDRVWAWFQVDRNKQPVAVCMLADEISEQDVHGTGITVTAADSKSVTVQPVKGTTRVLQAAGAEIWRGEKKTDLASLRSGDKVYIQTAGSKARLVLDSAAFAVRRAAQKEGLRRRWTEEGLPGTVSLLHIFSGEMELLLDHEGMRWARALKLGDAVRLQVSPAIAAVVARVEPWHERTRLRLVVNGLDQAELSIGQRLRLWVPAPPKDLENAPWPVDADRPRSRDERVEWVLQSMYCPCGIGGDGCTGHFYTLASCNPNGCGMPKHMREVVGQMIDRGLNDRQIFEDLIKEYGPVVLRPHLAP